MPRPVPVLLLVRELNLGGCERDLTRLALGLDRSRFTPHVASPHPEGLRADELRSAGVPLFRLPLESFLSADVWRAGRALLRYCRQHGIRIVHAWDIPMTLFAAPAGRCGRDLKVVTAQLSYRGFYRGWEQKLLWLTDRLSDRVAVNCQTVIDDSVERFRMPRAKAALIYNGVDTAAFRPGPRNRSLLPDSFRQASLVIGTVCALRREKSLETILEAFAAAGPAQRDWRLVIVGSGAELGKLQALSRSLGVEALCHFEPQTAEVPAWLKALDVFVLSSTSESFPNGLLEAMACGCAVVGTRIGGVPEMIEEGRSGLLFPVGDASRLREHLVRLADPALRADLASAGAQRAVERFSAERFCQAYEDLYDELLADRK